MISAKKSSRRFISIILFLLFILIFLSFSIASLYFYLTSPVNKSDSSTKLFVVKKGESITSIGNRLQDAGLIRSSLLFKIIVKKEGLTNKIQAGDFRLKPSLSLTDIARSLTHGTLDIWVTAIEGWRREEIADEISAEFAANGLEFDQGEFLSLTAAYEGRLFPDTYLIPKSASPGNIVDIFTANFDKKITPLLPPIEASGKSLEDILIMASIVEREARGDDRPIIAGILWKRLDQDWPLQADATLQYLKGYSKTEKTWWPQPLAIDKEAASAFNTYKRTGLPPAPICNPSLDSILAAISPQESNYWYYLNDPNDGQTYYSTTLEEHNQKVRQYLR